MDKKGKKNSLILHFIKNTNKAHIKKNPNFIIKGLILPANSILSKSNSSFLKNLNLLKVNQKISINWQDVVFVENDIRTECSVMYTEGTIFKNNKDHIVLKNSETIRMHPLPIKNHPKIKPAYYVIPKSFIIDFKIL